MALRPFRNQSFAGPDASRTVLGPWPEGVLYFALDTNELWVRNAGVWELLGAIDATGLLTESALVALLQDSTTVEWAYDDSGDPHTLTAAVPANTFAAADHTHSGVTLPDGTATGDFLRWDGDSWAVAGEPLQLTELILTPAAAAALDAEGALWYKSTDKAVYVCTEGA